MKKNIPAIIIYLFMIAIAIIITIITFLIVYAFAKFVIGAFKISDHTQLISFIIAMIILIVSTITAIKDKIPDLAELKWDSATVIEDCPSKINLSCIGSMWLGGSLWNMSVLGPRSMTSMVSIISYLLCLGPAIAVTATFALHKTIEYIRSNNHE